MKITREPAPSKTYELDEKTYKRLSLPHTLPVVLFEPEDLRLLSGGPERRRDYLDDLLEQTEPGYGTVRRKYRRALAQRNASVETGRHCRTDFPLGRAPERTSRADSPGPHRAGGTSSTKTSANCTANCPAARLKFTLEYQARWPAGNYETKLLKELENSLELDLRPRLHRRRPAPRRPGWHYLTATRPQKPPRAAKSAPPCWHSRLSSSS